MAAPVEETPWHAAFPAPKTAAASVSRVDVLQWLQGQERVAGRDFVLVDVRRVDFEVSYFLSLSLFSFFTDYSYTGRDNKWLAELSGS